MNKSLEIAENVLLSKPKNFVALAAALSQCRDGIKLKFSIHPGPFKINFTQLHKEIWRGQDFYTITYVKSSSNVHNFAMSSLVIISRLSVNSEFTGHPGTY